MASRTSAKNAPFDEDRHALLLDWLAGLNNARDARPAFVTPYGEVDHILAKPDWASRLRDQLGLAHLGGTPDEPLAVVLCRYNLEKVQAQARDAQAAAWAAVPTVLEAGGVNGPGPAFFPFPKAASDSNPFGFGVTVDLSGDGTEFTPEFLHFRHEYALEDFVGVAELTDAIGDARLAAARLRHFDLLEADFAYRSDAP